MDKHTPCPYGQTHHLSIWTNTPPVHMAGVLKKKKNRPQSLQTKMQLRLVKRVKEKRCCKWKMMQQLGIHKRAPAAPDTPCSAPKRRVVPSEFTITSLASIPRGRIASCPWTECRAKLIPEQKKPNVTACLPVPPFKQLGGAQILSRSHSTTVRW